MRTKMSVALLLALVLALILIVAIWYWGRPKMTVDPVATTVPTEVLSSTLPLPLPIASPSKKSSLQTPTALKGVRQDSASVELDPNSQLEVKKCFGYTAKTLENVATRVLQTLGKPQKEVSLFLNHHIKLENGQTVRVHQKAQEDTDASIPHVSVFTEDDEGNAEPSANAEIEGKSAPEILEFYRARGKTVLVQEQKLLTFSNGIEIEIHRANTWVENLEIHSPTLTLSCGIIFEPSSDREYTNCKCIQNLDAEANEGF